MKLVKRIPFQMFIRNLSAALVCIYGMLIMQYNLNEIVDNYEHNIEESVRDRLDMADICRLMNRHHILLSWHTLSESDEEKNRYEEDIIEQSGGSHFDPEMEKLFCGIRSEIIKVLCE